MNGPDARTPVPSRVVVPKGTAFKTFKGNVKLSQGQTLGFQDGKGYYAKGQPVGQGEAKNAPPFTRPVPPPSRTIVTTSDGRPAPRPRPAQAQSPLPPAEQSANAALAPMYAGQKADAAAQNAAITNFTQAIIKALGGTPEAIAGDYNNAIGQQTNLANAAADSLRAANPNTQDQALLSAINAPQSQHDAIAGQLGQVFNGGAAVGQYLNGVLPADSLRGQGLAAETLARLQPGFEGLRGQQALAGALLSQQEAKAKIDAMRPDLLYKYQQQEQAARSATASQSARDQQLELERQALGLRTQGQGFSQNLSVAKLNQQQNQFISRQRQQIATFNARQTNAQNKLGLPNASLSRASGYLVDSTGKAIPGPSGKKQVLPGFKMNDQGQVVKTSKAGAAGRPFVDLTKTQVQTLRATANELRFGTTDKAGKKLPPLPYGKAIRFLVGHGYSRNDAVAMLNNFYPAGQNGRPSKAAGRKVRADNAAARQGKDATGLGIQVGP